MCNACQAKMEVLLYKNTLVLVEDKVYFFMGISNDPEDIFYILKDLHGKILYFTFVGSIVPLFDRIPDKDYYELLSTFELNDHDKLVIKDESNTLKCGCKEQA